MNAPTPDPLDVLFTVPPDRFVAERDALARALREAGKPEQAARAAALRRPTASVFAVNQAARADSGRVEALLEASARLRQEQGSGDAEALRAALQVHRAALRALVGAADDALRGAGIRGEHARAIETDLQMAAAGSREQREQLRAGRLTSDLAAAGFDALAAGAAQLQASARRPPPAAPHESVAARKREEQERLEEKRRELQEKSAAAEAARKLAELKRSLHAAEAEAHRLDALVRKLEGQAERAESAARAARDHADAARRELAAAAARVDALRRSLAAGGSGN